MGIQIDSFKELVSDHMSDQPYSVKCDDCGNDLNCNAEVDSDFDLKLTIEPCAHCLEEAVTETEIRFEGRP